MTSDPSDADAKQPGIEPQSSIEKSIRIMAAATTLALLYFARDVLVPLAIAIILSLLIAPLVRFLRRVGLGQTVSVLVAVSLLIAGVAGIAAAITAQFFGMAESLPQYEQTLSRKFAKFDEITTGKFRKLDEQTNRTQEPEARRADSGDSISAATSTPDFSPFRRRDFGTPIPVEIHEPSATSIAILQRLSVSLWTPLESTGIVLVVLLFVLLEHENLRDRFIRIAGGADIRATTLALNDAGERLSRFFVSQFAVNFGVSSAVAVGLAVIGLPHALLLGTLAGVLRFIPYVGLWIAALLATTLAACVEPGWSLVILTVSLFIVIELIVGQLIEPQLYGHTTGLSPLSVVVAAIFWSWLWGAAGLIVSTPLTLCLLVAGRHIKGLNLLDVLLGDSHALTMPQRFYQRALSGDSQEIIANAKAFLKLNSFATYCDMVLVPTFKLAGNDLDSGAIDARQQKAVRDTIVAVIGVIASAADGRRPFRGSALDTKNMGRALRGEREQISGPYQGPLAVPPGSVMICVSLGSDGDDLAAELLVRILRGQRIDARNLGADELDVPIPADASAKAISTIILVSASPDERRQNAHVVADSARRQFADCHLMTLFFPGILLQSAAAPDEALKADKEATSFGEAVQMCLDMQKAKPPVP